ncbi:phage virion morphogenesis protein [Pararhizobium gei]|uniref:phage virion morphogenesis protein n=1 Tax=Pararhizobium gei TaxID=1395951 RepID=UPI0023DBBA62|nr:phage virion morphogenesis protein [Rhizobium gei]
MAPIVYTLELKSTEAREAVNRLVASMSNRQGFYKNVGEHLLNSTADNFRLERSPEGIPWKRLMPKTIAKREKLGQVPITILRARGRLAGSINMVATNEETRLGTPVPYAAIHQLGGEIKKKERQQTIYQRYNPKTDTLDQKFRRKSKSNFARDVTVKEHVINIPARPYLGASEADEKIIVGIAEEWLLSENPDFK